MGKSTRIKKKAIEDIMYFNGVGTSSSIETPLTQEKAEKIDLAHRIRIRYELLEEKRSLEGMAKKKEEEAIKKVKGETLKEKKDPGAFIFPIWLEGLVNENALADTGSNVNTMPYRIYEQLGRNDLKNVNRSITMINYTEAEVTGLQENVLSARSNQIRTSESDSDDEEDYVNKRNDMGTPIQDLRPIRLWEDMIMRPVHREANGPDKVKPWTNYYYRKLIMNFYNGVDFVEVCANDKLQSKKIIKFRLIGRNHSLTLLEFSRRLGLYQAEELDEEGFDIYFQSSLRTEEHFNAQEYWLTIANEDSLNLSRSSAARI
ncbi:hypothetical protein Tco_0038567 [Tanacetum coccineum]